MSLTTTRLAGNRVLVKGTDLLGYQGSEVIDSSEWDSLGQALKHDELHEQFDEKIREFFAPITAAADALHEAHKVNVDPAFYITIQEGVDATPGQPEEIVHLSRESVILRLLEQGAQDRLIWVNNVIEILESPAAVRPEDEAPAGFDGGSDVPSNVSGDGDVINVIEPTA